MRHVRCVVKDVQRQQRFQVTRNLDRIVIKPKKLADPDDILTPAEEALVRRGEAQLKRGEAVLWEDVKKKLKTYR